MKYIILKRKILLCYICATVFFINNKSFAQDFTGIALIKPYSFSADNQINEAIVYDSSYARENYFTFELNKKKRNIESGRIVKVYEIANPDNIPNISNDNSINGIKVSIPRIEFILKNFKFTENVVNILKSRLTSLKESVKNYENNQIKSDGIWLKKTEYIAREKANMEAKAHEASIREELRQEEYRKKEEEKLRIAEEVRLQEEQMEKQRVGALAEYAVNIKNKIMNKNATFDDCLSFCNFTFKTVKNEDELLVFLLAGFGDPVVDNRVTSTNDSSLMKFSFSQIIFDAINNKHHNLTIHKYTTVKIIYNMTVEQSMFYRAGGANMDISQRMPIGSQTEIEYSIKSYDLHGHPLNDNVIFAKFISKN
jgi:hypothetical protein